MRNCATKKKKIITHTNVRTPAVEHRVDLRLDTNKVQARQGSHKLGLGDPAVLVGVEVPEDALELHAPEKKNPRKNGTAQRV